MSASRDSKTIGNLNGKWSILFRATLALGAFLQPALLALGVWLVNEAFASRAFRDSGDRFTSTDGARLEHSLSDRIHRIEAELRKEIAELPPHDFRKKVDNMDVKIEAIAAGLVDLKIAVSKLK